MKKLSAKEKTARRDWLLRESEKLRQECNQLTDGQRRTARQRALKIIYGTDAIPAIGGR